MTVSTEAPTGPVAAAERRAGRELVLDLVFRPLSSVLVPALARLHVPPPVVVLANAATGLVAAFALARGQLLAAAVLLQLKTLLDNTDGQLARATDRVTLAGRYLDTVADLVVNAAVFAALGYVTGQPWLAAAAFAALTLVLAVDFNLTELYRELRGLSTLPAVATGGRAERALESVYAPVFGTLDRLVRTLSDRRFAQLVAPDTSPERARQAKLAYDDRLTVTVLANLGLTTQLFVLGICLVLRRPELYLWFALACLVLLVPLQLRAEQRARTVLTP